MNIRSGILFVLLVGFLVVAQSVSAAITLSLSPSPATFSVGDTFDVELVIAGLNAGAPPGVGAFDLNIDYDPGLLSAVGVTFGTALGDPDLDALSASDLATPGNVNVAEVSLLDTATLVSTQPSSFTLAKITFTALADGTSGFSLVGDLRVDDPLGNKLAINVPEPDSVGLLLVGLAIGGWRIHLTSRRPPRSGVAAARSRPAGRESARCLPSRHSHR